MRASNSYRELYGPGARRVDPDEVRSIRRRRKMFRRNQRMGIRPREKDPKRHR